MFSGLSSQISTVLYISHSTKHHVSKFDSHSTKLPAKPAKVSFTPKPILPNTANISDQALHVIINVS